MGFYSPFRAVVGTVMILGAVTIAPVAQAQTSPRERVSFNADWRFQKDDPTDAAGKLDYTAIKDWIMPTGSEFSQKPASVRPAGTVGIDFSYTQPEFNDATWRTLNLPHDWGIEGPFQQSLPGETGKLPWFGIGWYRKHFKVASSDKGKQIFLDVDGAMSHAAVWLNGQFVGGWPYGYASFELDLTPYIKPGSDNVVSIRLDNPPNSSRWYPGGGIYRNVWLVKTSQLHVAHWGVVVTTPQITKSAATVDVKVAVDNQSATPSHVVVKTVVYELGPNGNKLPKPVLTLPSAVTTAEAGATVTVDKNASLANPKLWSIASPHRYVAVTTLTQADKTIDSVETPFGIRTIKFDADTGFWLNGEHVRLNGVCNHADLGALGTAVNTRGLERQIELLKEMGCNAIRTSHNPPAPELLDLCDRMGMVVMDESFDCWQWGKKPNDYHTLFTDWHEKDVRAQVRRDRNHPCVILWSVGNEIPEQGNATEGPARGGELVGYIHQEDPTRPATVGCSDTKGGYNGYQKVFDVFGYNYRPYEYGRFHAANPTIPLFGSETSSCISSRGEYFFPVTNEKSGGKSDFQMSSYDLYAPGWAMPPDAEFKGQDQNPFVAGEFVWTGFDYIGEPTPYNGDTTNLLNFTDPADKAKMEQELKDLGKIRVPSRSSYFGILDLAGFKKDRFYLYQARWRPELPMAHILPHWNWPDRVGQVTPVFVYTSGDEAELFLNDKSLGRKRKAQYEYRLRWDDVVYEPGELRVIAYKDGKQWAENSVKTTGAAAKVTLQADRSLLKADGQDLSYVTVAIADKDGLMVPRSKNLVKFSLSGPGEIVATDNGDATSFVPFQSHEREAFNGLALVIIRTKPGQSGTIKLTAQSDGLQGSTVSIKSKS